MGCHAVMVILKVQCLPYQTRTFEMVRILTTVQLACYVETFKASVRKLFMWETTALNIPLHVVVEIMLMEIAVSR